MGKVNAALKTLLTMLFIFQQFHLYNKHFNIKCLKVYKIFSRYLLHCDSQDVNFFFKTLFILIFPKCFKIEVVLKDGKISEIVWIAEKTKYGRQWIEQYRK